jgi:hypothetical protein
MFVDANRVGTAKAQRHNLIFDFSPADRHRRNGAAITLSLTAHLDLPLDRSRQFVGLNGSGAEPSAPEQNARRFSQAKLLPADRSIVDHLLIHIKASLFRMLALSPP